MGPERVGFDFLILEIEALGKSFHTASGFSCLRDRNSFLEGLWLGLEKLGTLSMFGAWHEVDTQIEAFIKLF